MTATVLPPDVVEALKPDYVAPLVAFLSHPDCEETDGVYEVGSGWIARVRLQRSRGVVFPTKNKLYSEMIASHWEKVISFDPKSVEYPTTPSESLSLFYERVMAGGDKIANSQAAVGPLVFDYTEKDVALYNLGIGATNKDLKWVYEGDPNFEAIPSFGICPPFRLQTAVDYDSLLQNFNFVR